MADHLYENGLLAPSWPQQYGGGGLTPLEQVVVAEEFYRAGVPTGGPHDGFGIQMVGNTLLHWGTDRSRRATSCPRILSGEDRWCQGYSEPGPGSDLANLGTRAVLDGDEWVINGQKIWTSAAEHGQLDLRAGPHRSRRPEAQGHHLPAGADGPAPGLRSGPSG